MYYVANMKVAADNHARKNGILKLMVKEKGKLWNCEWTKLIFMYLYKLKWRHNEKYSCSPIQGNSRFLSTAIKSKILPMVASLRVLSNTLWATNLQYKNKHMRSRLQNKVTQN